MRPSEPFSSVEVESDPIHKLHAIGMRLCILMLEVTLLSERH